MGSQSMPMMSLDGLSRDVKPWHLALTRGLRPPPASRRDEPREPASGRSRGSQTEATRPHAVPREGSRPAQPPSWSQWTSCSIPPPGGRTASSITEQQLARLRLAAAFGQKQRRSLARPNLVEPLAPAAGYRFDRALVRLHRHGSTRSAQLGPGFGIAQSRESGCRAPHDRFRNPSSTPRTSAMVTKGNSATTRC